MDDKYPFGESFGLAADRNQCIDSSHAIYYQLKKFSPGSNVLPFEVLSWITLFEENNEVQNEAKLKALRRLFRPDAHGNLPLLAFVQVKFHEFYI